MDENATQEYLAKRIFFTDYIKTDYIRTTTYLKE